MFSSRSKDTTPQKPLAAALAPQARRLQAAPSIISTEMAIQGNVNSGGDTHIDGRVEGDVRSNGLVIGDKAEVLGEIHAEDVTVRGKVVGRIYARKVLLTATAHVEGDILHETLAMEPGSFFDGNCRRMENPLGAPQPAARDSKSLDTESAGFFSPLGQAAT